MGAGTVIAVLEMPVAYDASALGFGWCACIHKGGGLYELQSCGSEFEAHVKAAVLRVAANPDHASVASAVTK